MARDFATEAAQLQELALAQAEELHDQFGAENAIRGVPVPSKQLGALLHIPSEDEEVSDENTRGLIGTADYLHLHALIRNVDEVRAVLPDLCCLPV